MSGARNPKTRLDSASSLSRPAQVHLRYARTLADPLLCPCPCNLDEAVASCASQAATETPPTIPRPGGARKGLGDVQRRRQAEGARQARIEEGDDACNL